ncbi:MAG: glycosyltransferase family A protein [Nitratireductor sp.]
MRISSHNNPDLTTQDRPQVTVFCAVWHKQDNKLELLKSHWENLKQQSLPVEPCYIFDNGDTAPDWLDAPWHSFSEPLTIYEAWGAGVALAKTRYVMNLNMDDRLSTDAAEILFKTLKSQNASLAGGEWVICFDQDFQTETFSSAEEPATHFVSDWPPVPSEKLRLGSGTGERGTFGPATMWDLQKTDVWYPSYFGNRAPILSIGDNIFWRSLREKGHKRARNASVIGRYYSSPDEQAEFRPHNDAENLREHGVARVSFAQMVAAGQPPENQRPAMPAPRNRIEARSQELGAHYLKLFGRTAPSQPTV